MTLKTFIDKINTPRNMFVLTVLMLITSLPQFLAFFGLKQASDTIDTIYNATNMYKNFNVDLKILVWSMINFGIALYLSVYKSPTNTQKKIDELTTKVNEMEKQLSMREADLSESVEALNKQLNELSNEMDMKQIQR